MYILQCLILKDHDNSIKKFTKKPFLILSNVQNYKHFEIVTYYSFYTADENYTKKKWNRYLR